MRLVRFSSIGSIVFSGLLLATTMTSVANAQGGWYEGWTSPNSQSITDPFSGVANQQFFENNAASPGLDDPFFGNRSNDNGLDHPFFNNSNQPNSPLQNKSKTLKPMFGVEAIFLSRSGLDDVDFVFDDNGPSLSYADIDPGSSTTARVRLGYMDGRGQGFEWVSADFGEFGTTQVVNGPNVLPVIYSTVPVDAETSWDVTYKGELSTHELNVWVRTNDHFRYGVGARYIDLRENFDVLVSAQNTNGFFSDVDNDLFGAQWVGEYSRPISNTLELVVGVKLGGFYNNIDSRFFAENVQFHLENSAFSFVTDFNAGVSYHISQSTTFSLGYQLLNLTNVSVAPDQSRSVQAFSPDADDIAFGNALFNGAYAGLNVRF